MCVLHHRTPLAGRRVLASESSTQSSSISSLTGLLDRQIGSCSTLDSSDTFAQTFSSFRLKRCLDVGNSDGPRLSEAAVELVATDTVLVCLYFGGQCHAYDRRSGHLLCCLNKSVRGEGSSCGVEFRSIFHNVLQDSLLIVMTHSSDPIDDSYMTISCHSCSLESIRRGAPDMQPLATDLDLAPPSFVEFDDLNSKLLIYCGFRCYRMYSLGDYSALYAFSAEEVADVKMSEDLLLVVSRPQTKHLPLSIRDISNGQQVELDTGPGDGYLKFAFLFNYTVFVKMSHRYTQVHDLCNGLISLAPAFGTPSEFIFLHDRNIFLTFNDAGTASIWNAKGERMATLADKLHMAHTGRLYRPNLFFFTPNDLIAMYCQSETGSNEVGYLAISDTKGRCLARIHDNSTLTPALQGVTALYYDEQRHEIVTGHRRGELRIWSN